MTMRPKQPHVLLIRSPFCLTGSPPWGWAQTLSDLQYMTADVRICDAAMGYVNEFLLNNENFEQFVERPAHHSLEMGTRKVGSGVPHQILKKLARYLERIGILWHSCFQEAQTSPDTICHGELLDLSDMLDVVLDSASAAYAPCRFHRHGFAHPGLNQLNDLIAFADDADANPFYHYAANLWHPFDVCVPPDVALLYAASTGQIGPAITLASAWQTRWPHIPMILVGEAFAEKGLAGKISRSSGKWSFNVIADMTDFEKKTVKCVSSSSNQRGTSIDGLDNYGTLGPFPLIAEQIPSVVETALRKTRTIIKWHHWRGGEIDEITKALYAASRKGIWNHLILDEDTPSGLADLAMANANIVHSYCWQEEPISIFSDPLLRFPSASNSYGRTKPLPGRPFWMEVQDPEIIGKLLTRSSIKTVMRLRARNAGQPMFEVGKNLSYHFKHPNDLPDGHLNEIIRMVEAGGSVNTQFVRHNLERAYLIAYVEEAGGIIGNSSLKHPRKEYIHAVSRQSGIDLHHFLERGYTSVRPEYRGVGVGAKLLEGLTERAGSYKIFSVIAENNIATQKMAIRNRTRRVATFFSQRAKKEMSVWIPEWMLPKGIVLPEQPDLGP